MTLLLSQAPVFGVIAVLLLLERLRGAPPSDWRRNLQAWVMQIVVAVTVLPLLDRFAGPGLIDARRLPFWAGFALFFVIKDLGEYLYHRAQHLVPWLWAMHSLHHSDPEMGVLTTYRHFWGDQLLKQVTIWGAALTLITPTPAILLAFGLASLWNLFAHADLDVNFGRWSWLLNSPAYHRRHHSSDPEHFNSNFAAVLPIFDVILGSYRRPVGFPQTGLERAPQSWSELALWPLVWWRCERGTEARTGEAA